MNMKVIGVEIDGEVGWHVPGVSGPDYVTLCGLDGNDPGSGQTGTVVAPRGTKIDCEQCRVIWHGLTALKLRKSDFIDG